MIIKYGKFYITWYNLSIYEFGVGDRETAHLFDSESEAHEIMRQLGLQNYEVER